jgi:uncharacterized protein (DUF488 family)
MSLNPKIKKPVYKRQQFLLAFVQQLQKSVSLTDLQKLVFLYSTTNDAKHYNFLPYKYGAYSFQLAQDVDVLELDGYIVKDNNRIISLDHRQSILVNSSSIDTLRGKALIRKTYEKYPYYAINSEIAGSLMDNVSISKIERTKASYISETKQLFTIGYEGKTVEHFANELIQHGVRVLCDVRKNPISRKFGFSQKKLKHIVETVGIKYEHIPDLGIESQDRQYLETDADYVELFTQYRLQLPKKQNSIDLLIDRLNTQKRIALVCYEQDPKYCHRKQIADYIVSYSDVESEDL